MGKLIRYKLFDDDLLLFELVNGGSAASTSTSVNNTDTAEPKPTKVLAASTLAMKTHADQIATASPE